MESEREKVWTEKYRPMKFDQLAYNTQHTKMLEKLIVADDFPHILLYGPPGAGKRTFTRCILDSLFGPESNNMKSEIKEYKINTTIVEFLVYYSNHHIEIAPTNSEMHDRVIVNNMIRDVAESQPIKKSKANAKEYKIIVIHEL